MSNSFIQRDQGRVYLVVEIDTYKCLTANGMYKEFDEAFSFPPTPNYGSLNVLNDYLTDLGWQKVKNYKIVLTNLDKANKKDVDEVREVIDFLEIVKEYWNREKLRRNNKFENDFMVVSDKEDDWK